MRYALLFPCLLGLLALMPPQAAAAGDVAARLAQVEQERAKLAKLRGKLEQRLGRLGAELRALDEALVQARTESRTAAAALARTDHDIAELEQRRQRLQEQLDRLRTLMTVEAAAAYRHGDTKAPWLVAVLQGDIATLPHKRYMLARLLQLQEAHRRQYSQGMEALALLRRQLVEKRDQQAALKRRKQAAKERLAARLRAKRELWRRLQKDAELQRQREQQLAAQAEALRQLLDELRASLLPKEDDVAWVPLRQRKGSLAWPLKGRIVARFGERPAAGRKRLAGVQLAPLSAARQVKAIAAGQVRYADWFGGYGLMLIIDHGDGMMSVYAHNDTLYKSLGDWVEEGEVVAEAGSTGWVEDVRLYFELRDGGKPLNPSRWCRR